jgi:hypothetical protein
MASTVSALHHVLIHTCPSATDVDEEEGKQSAASPAGAGPGAWKLAKPVRLFIQLPGVLQLVANGIDVLKVLYMQSSGPGECKGCMRAGSPTCRRGAMLPIRQLPSIKLTL